MLVIGISGTRLQPEERDWLAHPGVGGVILFTRNFASPAQVSELCASLRERARPLILSWTEGGPVSFRDVYGLARTVPFRRAV